jgi:hypothetical protein
MVDDGYVQQAAYDLQRVLRNEIDDCGRAIRRGDMQKAAREIGDAESKLKRILQLLQAAL